MPFIMQRAHQYRWLTGICLVMLLALATVILHRNRQPAIITLEQALPSGILRIGIDSGYAPFAMLDESGALQGVDIDIARAIAHALNTEVQFIPIGYDGLYDALTTDRVDAIISALIIDPRRTRDVRYTIPYFDNGLVLVTPPNTPPNPDWYGRNIAFEYGSHADGEIRQRTRRITHINLMPYEKPVYALDAMRLDYADWAVVDATTLYLYLNQHADWHIDAHFLTHVEYAIATRADREDTYHTIQWGLINILETGRLDAILDDWFNRPLSPLSMETQP